MKKFLLTVITLICAFSMVFGLVACAPADDNGGASVPSTAPTTAPTVPSTGSSLSADKDAAKAELDGLADAKDYREAQQSLLAAAIADGKAAIDAAADKAGVDAALAAAKAAVKAIPTDAELTAAEDLVAAEALAAAKTATKNALDAYAKAEDYRDVQKADLAAAIEAGKAAIDAAADKAGVEAALANAKAVIDQIPTDAELTTAEELAAAASLAEAKTIAKTALDSYASADNYRNAEKALLAAAIADGKTAIDAAIDKAGVEAALAGAKAAIDEIPTDAELTAAEEQAAAEALATAKAVAKTALDNYANAGDYRDEQKAELAAAIEAGKASIDAAADTAAVDAAVAAAKLAIDAIETDAEMTAKSPTITSTVTDGKTYTNTKATVDVWVKDANGAKLNASKVTVTVNGVPATINWDDNEKTSYNLVFEAGENTVVITARDGNYSTTVTYTVSCDLTKPTTITVSVEGFTVGKGYFVAPFKLAFDDETLSEMADMYGYSSAAEMKENLTAAYALDYTLQIHGLAMGYDGDLCAGGSFYMSYVSGLDTSGIAVPDTLQEKLDENGYSVDPEGINEEGTFSEFDITWGSGWMYMINNVGPNVGFCDYVPQDGDVMRVQYVLGYGSDIGIPMVGECWFETVDRDELTELIAEAIEQGVDYSEAFAVVSAFGITQDDLDAAAEALSAELDS